MSKKQELTATNLKQTLWETLNGILGGRVDPAKANAVATQSREIMRVVRTELAILQISGQRPTHALFDGQKTRH